MWKNTSRTNRRHVTLGISLLDRDRNIINRDFARRVLPKPLNAGERLKLDFQVPPLQHPGEYWLKFDMVCEGLEWFESCGSPPAYMRLQVH